VQPAHVLDVGTATGHPLESIVGVFQPTTKVLGIDIDKNYIPACTKLFAEHPNV
jgi:ubiquinone/menaquinone biosynthesis C-methylase UbiE